MRRLLSIAAIACAAACASTAATSSSEDEVGSRPEREWNPAAPKQGNLRIATWNVRNFPKDVMGATDGGADAAADPATAPERDTRPIPLVRKQEETDLNLLVDLLDRLDFDVLAVQEINDTARFDAVLAKLGEKNGRSYQSAYSLAWEHPQHVGIIVRRDHARIEDPKVHGEVATRPTMRAALTARIVSTKAGGADFGLMVVHLASGDTGGRATLRATQATEAAKVIAARQAQWADKDFIVVGDMNTARDDQELPAFEAAFATSTTTLAREKPESTCSTYYTKGPTNPLLEPSYIDHVFLASMAERDKTIPVTAGAHCFERSCKPFESDTKDNGTSYWAVSDHCPVYFEVADEDRD